jgi:hypothetical protein
MRGLMGERGDERIVGEQYAIAPRDQVDKVADLGQPVLPPQLVLDLTVFAKVIVPSKLANFMMST